MGLNKNKILLVGPIPPPFSGPEVGTETLLYSSVFNDAFHVRHVDTTIRKSNQAKGRLDMTMIIGLFSYMMRLSCTLISFRPDILLYLPTSATRKGWVRDGTTILLGRMFNSKVIIQFRGGHFRLFYNTLSPLGKNILRFLLNLCSKVYAQSKGLTKMFSGIVPEERTGFFYNFVLQRQLDSFFNLKRTVKNRSAVILFVGHLSFAKGYCDLLTVFGELSGTYDIQLALVGEKVPTERNVLFNQFTGERLVIQNIDECYERFIVKKGAESKVQFRGGGVHGVEKVDLFRNADMFVLPSYSEGFSMAVLEAMAAGLPVITTTVGAFPDIIVNGRTGFLVPPGDRGMLRECIEKLLSQPQLRFRMGDEAREACRQRFKEDVVLGSLARELLDIAEK